MTLTLPRPVGDLVEDARPAVEPRPVGDLFSDLSGNLGDFEADIASLLIVSLLFS